MHGAERVAEWRRVALVVPSPPKAGPSRAPLGQPKKSVRRVDHQLGIVIPEKNCSWCVARQMLCLWKWLGMLRAVSSAGSSRNPVGDSRRWWWRGNRGQRARGEVEKGQRLWWCEVCLRYSYQKPARNGLYADGL